MSNFLVPSSLLFLFGFFALFGIRTELGFTQLANFFVGLIAFIVLKKIGATFFKTNAKFFYWFFVFLLIMTYVIGLEVKGSKRWIDLYFFHFQASEFFKVFFIMFFAQLFSRKIHSSQEFMLLTRSIAYFIIPTIIIFKQPDLGNAMVYVFIFLIMLLFSDISKKHIFPLFGSFLIFMPLGWFFMKDYQRNRILSFFNPHVEEQRNAYNMIQAVITIGSGKWFGKGLGFGTQSRLYFLPENSTDFAFSSLVEQFGFVGGGIVILLFAILFYMLIQRVLKYIARDDEEGRYKFLYTLGLLAFFVIQVFVNIGMNLGILPIAGIALPFISYGGSLIVTIFIGYSLL